MEPGDLVKLSQAELSMRLGTDTGGSWRNKRGRGKVRVLVSPSFRVKCLACWVKNQQTTFYNMFLIFARK